MPKASKVTAPRHAEGPGYAPPGHTPAAAPGTETIEFTPSEELARTMAVVMKNAQALGAQV